ncbi:tudor domain-containing 6 isoform X2 [Phyllopteryx taeniolatus]|uniref:tudor domain-containing 6 isoform X2 n=1 Tax=Phyllopteryx taeniolatus TaxID=161469 RepID=UPI002AD29D33|nr:tudor domain-containing 6 isoform X2 [Phyllopteryx taeniolatus]
MASILGLPPRSSNVTILITRVHSYPICGLIEFWANFAQARAAEYQSLAKNIQSPANAFPEFEGNPGDLCLVQIDGTWYRSRIVTRNGSNCKVFLIDEGITCSTTTKLLALGKREHFHLSPAVELCVLANVFPLSPENRWSSVALEFLQSLRGQTVKAHVQDVLVHERKLLLDIPCISRQMYEMGLAKKLEPSVFLDFVLKSLKPKSEAENFFQTSMGEVKQLNKEELYMYPEVSAGAVETVVVTEVTNPQRVFCQLKVFSQELNKLSEQITQRCRGTKVNCIVDPEMIGFPCAARGNDGNWYRCVLQQVFPVNQMVEVLNVDYGTKQLVQIANVRPLAPEFFRMPVVTYVCSLHGIIDKGIGWTSTQISYLKSLLLHKTLIAKFQYQSISEGVYYVSLYGDENKNLNNMFCSKENTLQESEKTLDYAIGNGEYSSQHHSPGQRDTSKMLCSSGLAERNEIEKTSQIFTQYSEAGFLGVCGNSEVSFPTQNVDPSSKELQIGKFKEHMFPIGTVLDVSVSYIESPNDFWCQLARNSWQLKLLMHSIQAHYAGSIYEPLTEAVCVVHHPDNGIWYRARVIHKHETTHVTVLFVDYGQTKTVPLHELRTINAEFLNLHSQAFRCSLFNPPKFMSVVNDWNDEAKEKFYKFVETAASNSVTLKCTIYAVMYNEKKIALNIVDLETPFESISESMATLAHSAPGRTVPRPSFRLDTYYYSTHNIKTGIEEQVTVTCVNSVSQFYCQLERNADVLKDLNVKVNNLCHQLGIVEPPTVFGKLCFAKYTDGLWYRAQIKATKPSILVHFVDYGDTAKVDKSDLLPVPKEANDIMSIPVQAVVCGLSDVPTDVPSEVNNWFKTSVTECKFQVLVVAKEPSGNLLVELYHKNTQINSKMKTIFQLEMKTEGQVLCQRQKALETPYANKEKEAISVFYSSHVPDPKPAHKVRQATQSSRQNLNNDQRVKTSQELYQTPHQRQHQSKQNSNNERKENLTVLNDSKLDCKSPVKESGNVLHQAKYSKLPKLEDLPKDLITLGMEADVYVSHYNSPSSFYVQLVREEDEIFSLVHKLNDPLSTPKISITEVDVGDLVEAEFADDSSWYRACVKQVLSSSMAVVEFVDFGNIVQLPFSKLAKLNQAFVQLPRYSTHCMLSEAESLEVLDAEVVSTLKRDIGSNAEKMLKCQFVQQSEVVWQVILEDNGVQVTCKAPAKCPKIPSDTEQKVEASVQNSEASLDFCSPCYHHIEFIQGQQLDVYISAICDAHKFWCQPADSNALDKISKNLSEIGNATYNTHVSMSALLPGSPCIAFFAEDQLWCRAEILNKDGDKLSVLFVDYGNTADVTITNVREMPSDLLETPTQAFLCTLEGFDELHGSWVDSAVDELASIAEDKLLQMIVTKTSREDGKNMYLVQLECDCQRLNETMKRWWMTSTLQNKPDVAQQMLDEKLSQIDATAKEPENEPPENEETRLSVPSAHTGKWHNNADLYSVVTSSPTNIQSPVDYLHTSVLSTESPQEERCLFESWIQLETSEGVNTVPTVLIHHMETNVSQIDSGIEENVLPLQNMVKNVDEEAATLIDTTLSDESGIPLSPFEAPAKCPEIPSDTEQNMGKNVQNSETSQNLRSLSYHYIEFTEGQQLDVYISAIFDTHKFWCQPADSIALDNISESLSEFGNAAYDTHVSMSALLPGTPCIAFFAEDQLWCRAEVLNKDGDELSVLFVDYGNTAEVTCTDVREICVNLLETHPQAFLCKLEGFDESHGSWCDSAFDELASIAEDKLLQLTVTKLSREDGKNMHLVQLECEGQKLNETMKRWWMTSTLENKPDVPQCILDEKLGPIDATAKEPENETSENEDARLAIPGAHTGKCPNDADLYSVVTSSPKNIQSPVDYLHTSILSSKSPQEEKCLSESWSTSEGVNTVPSVLIHDMESNVSHIDSGTDENVDPWQNMDTNVAESDKNFEEAASVLDTTLSDEIKSPPDKNLQEAADDCGIPLSPFEVVDIHMRACYKVRTYSADPKVATEDNKAVISNPVMSGTNVKMVARDAVMNYIPHETVVDTTSADSQLVPSESVLPFLVPVVQQLHDPNEQSDGIMAASNHCHITVTGEEMALNEPLHQFGPFIGQVIESCSEQPLKIRMTLPEEGTSAQEESDTVAEDTMTDFQALSFDTEARSHSHLCPDKDSKDEVHVSLSPDGDNICDILPDLFQRYLVIDDSSADTEPEE